MKEQRQRDWESIEINRSLRERGREREKRDIDGMTERVSKRRENWKIDNDEMAVTKKEQRKRKVKAREKEWVSELVSER